jgi:hypothetical protein
MTRGLGRDPEETGISPSFGGFSGSVTVEKKGKVGGEADLWVPCDSKRRRRGPGCQ